MHKAKEGSLPDNIQLFFKLKPRTNVVTRQEGKFYVVFAGTKLKSQCISIYGVKFFFYILFIFDKYKVRYR